MTYQQTAVDNALLEKLHAREFTGRIINPDGPEAADHIKSLQAERGEAWEQVGFYKEKHRHAEQCLEEAKDANIKLVREKQALKAALEIAAALSIKMEGDEAVRINRHWFAARLEALAQGEDPVQWAETMKLVLNRG